MATEHTTEESSILRKRPRKRRIKWDITKHYPLWAHPDVFYWAPIWAMIRDCAAGEQQIKSKESYYLPPLDEQSRDEYGNYLERAVYFNMTGRTVSALTGIVFQKYPKILQFPKREEENFRTPTRTGISFYSFLKMTTSEVLEMGRAGVLLDMDTAGKSVPYFALYTAENILDWSLTEIEGRLVPTEIVLREINEIPRMFGASRTAKVVYRVLRLEVDQTTSKWVYHQYVYETSTLNADLTLIQPMIVTPTRRGQTFDRIPFRFIGSLSNTPEVDPSPLADIAQLNLAHYRAYAQLEHGRFYTAMPIYYAVSPNGQSADYRVGSAVVWEVGVGETPGVIEFNGAGLKFLESSCSQKEDQIASLGGRLMGGHDRSVAESDNEVKLKEGNERSILLNAVMGINEAMTELTRLWLWWRDYDPAVANQAEIELSTQFLMDTLGARELRAIYAMYKDGVVPVTVLHYYLQQAGAVPDWMAVEEFKTLLDKAEEFPNQPDVLARMRGFGSNAEMLNQQIKERQVAVSERLARVQERDATVKEQEVKIEQELADIEVSNPAVKFPKMPPIKPKVAK